MNTDFAFHAVNINVLQLGVQDVEQSACLEVTDEDTTLFGLVRSHPLTFS